MNTLSSPKLALVLVVALGLVAADATAAPFGPTIKPAGGVSDDPVAGPAVGWPSSVRTAASTDCKRAPGPNEVIIASEPSFGGRCATLSPGFYPRAANLVVGNDTIRSMKIGSAVRARGFKDSVYAGAWQIFSGSLQTLGAFDKNISSMRVEPASRSQTCGDLREGEVALYETASYSGDCVVLPGNFEGVSYRSADAMGIENDSVSSVRNNTKYWVDMFWGTALLGDKHSIKPHSLYSYGGLNGYFDNQVSSMRIRP